VTKRKKELLINIKEINKGEQTIPPLSGRTAKCGVDTSRKRGPGRKIKRILASNWRGLVAEDPIPGERGNWEK